MKKETIEYLNGNRNVVKDEFVIGRERTSNNQELIFVSLPESEKPMYALWNSKKTAKQFVKENENEEIKFKRVSPKGTGGKKSFVMLMPNAFNEIGKDEFSIEAAGAIIKLSAHIEWNTGRLVGKRNGKALTRQMISELLNVGVSKAKTILNELNKLGIIRYDNKSQCYFVDGKFIRKGATAGK
ncbi:MAG: hypothetical protein WC373_05650 [Smithella sp.]|jgi:hypothetical protein